LCKIAGPRPSCLFI
jgi:hypothetical protein